MPVTLLTFPPDQVDVNYNEPLTSEPLNEKFAGVIPSGVHRGFRLTTDAGDRTVRFAADPVYNDHLLVTEKITGVTSASLTVRRTGGDFVQSLVAFAGTTILIAVHGSYAVGITTTVTLRKYTVAEYVALSADDKKDLVVLGQVVVPAGAGPISENRITYTRRDGSWMRKAPEALTWPPLVRNASFESGFADQTDARAAHFWESNITSGSAQWVLRGAGAGNTGDKAMVLRKIVAGAVTAELKQFLHAPVRPGQKVKLQFFYYSIVAPVASACTIDLVFLDTAGAVVSTLTAAVDLLTTGSYQKVDTAFTVPSGAYFLARLQVTITAVNWVAAAVDVLRFDDIQVWLEVQASEYPYQFEDVTFRAQAASEIIFGSSSFTNFSSAISLLRHVLNGAQPQLFLGRRDGAVEPAARVPELHHTGQLIVGEGIIGGTPSELARTKQPYADGVGTTQYTLQDEFLPNGATVGAYGCRFYTGGLGELIITINAKRSAANWVSDVTTSPSYKLVLAGDSNLLDTANKFSIYTKDATAGAWTDVAWTRENLKLDAASNFQASLAGGILAGQNLISTAALAEVARFSGSLSSLGTRTLMAEFGGGAQVRARMYGLPSSGAFEITTNARWDTTTSRWVVDSNGQSSIRFKFHNTTGLSIARVDDGPADFADSEWDTAGGDNEGYWQFNRAGTPNSLAGLDGRIQVLGPTTGVTGSNPSHTVGILNTIIAKSMVKAWGSIAIDGTPTITTKNGVNFDAAINGGADPYALDITFATPMANGNYAVAGMTNLNGVPASVGWLSFVQFGTPQNGFTLSSWKGVLAADQTSLKSCTVTFVVLGEQ